MSAVKSWHLDAEHARARARIAAGIFDQPFRVRALAGLCRELGDVANRYANPRAAACALVRLAVAEYSAGQRKSRPQVEFETLAQLIGLADDRIVYQVEYAREDTVRWEFMPASQHPTEGQARAALEKIQYEHPFTRIVQFSARVVDERECIPVAVYVDRIESGGDLVTFPNGTARVGKVGGECYWVECLTWDEGEGAPLPKRGGFVSREGAIQWAAKAMGHRGVLNITEERES